jgi:hypothetical protein
MPIGETGSPVNMDQPDQTYGVKAYGPSNVVSLDLPMIRLSDDEQAMVTRLTSLVESKRYGLELRDAHYRGTVRVQDLGISIPPSMRNVKIAPGFPRVCVDALDRRLNVDGFRYPDSNDVDRDLQEIWLGNDLDAEHPLAHLDALVFGCGYVGLGSPATGGNVIDTPPLITIESPLDIAVEWDARTRTIRAALRLFGFEGSRQATFYKYGSTISLIQSSGGWTVTGRDDHGLQPMIVRIPNRPRSYARDGASEITPEIMNITDAASRAMLGLMVAGEFYSAPQRYILGADESAFQAPDGTSKDGWSTYQGRILALESNADGILPTVGQFTAYDPSVFTKVIDSYCQRISALTGLPPYMLGFATANPTSADAIRSGEGELTRRADHKTVMFGKGWRDVMKLALLVRGGSLPDNAEKITTVWSSTSTPTIAATTDAVFKQVTMGYLPATSDVTGEALGYNAIQRERIEIDRAADQGQSMLQEIAHNLDVKAFRADQAITADAVKINQPAPAVTPTATPTATPGMMPKKMPGVPAGG